MMQSAFAALRGPFAPASVIGILFKATLPSQGLGELLDAILWDVESLSETEEEYIPVYPVINGDALLGDPVALERLLRHLDNQCLSQKVT